MGSRSLVHEVGSFPGANMSPAPGMSRIIATPAITHLAAGYLVFNYAGKT